MSGRRILVVEDEVVIALGLARSLERLGYEAADTVSTGEEAVARALELVPDLVLMDIILAGPMDGVAAARRIREEADIPVIYLSANADAATVERARDTMPYGYLNKPINERDLMTGIDAALQQHRMDRRLRESEEKYRGLVESLNDMVIATDERGTVTYVSPQVKDITGYEVHEVEGRNFNEFTHPEDRQMLAEMFAAGVMGAAQNREYRVVSREGETIWVRTSGRPVFTRGRFAGVSGVITDITERKRAEEEVTRANRELAAANEELRAVVEELESTNEEFEAINRELLGARDELSEKEALFRSILRAAPIGIGIVRDRVLGWTGGMMSEITGYSGEELEGRSARMLYLSDGDYEYVGKEKYRQIGERGTGSVETRWRRKDGSIIDIILSSTPLDQSNPGAALIFTALDITERKRAERSLAESEEKYRHFMENLSDSLWVLDLKTMKFIYNSPQSVHILGYTQEESKALSPEDVVTPDSLGVVARVLAEELERDGLPGVDPDRTRMMEIEQIHRDGSIVWCEMTMRFLRDGSGNPDRILGVSRNITDRRRMEQVLAESEERFRLLVEHSPFPISILDNATGRVTYSNRTMAEVLGYTIEEVPNLDKWWKAAYPDPAYREKNRVAWEQALAGAVKDAMESDVRCRDGSVRRIEFRFMPMGDTTAVIMNDVTGKRQPGGD
ncbi:MAG: PAS domain S-box protein [Spirochaetes bacterium]|nr:PAS domain S-box protein [Spirochaetota bacterium]